MGIGSNLQELVSVSVRYKRISICIGMKQSPRIGISIGMGDIREKGDIGICEIIRFFKVISVKNW